MILGALNYEKSNFIIGIGSSATNVMVEQVWHKHYAKLLNRQGTEIARGGAALATLAHISTLTMDTHLQECTLEVACDVTNPLCGPTGASAVYGPQKGATPAIVHELDNALDHYAQIIKDDLGVSVREIPGAGAAGGLGAGLIAFLHATLRPGTRLCLRQYTWKKEYVRLTCDYGRRTD